MIVDETNMFASVAVVGQVVALRMEAILVGRPVHGVGDALPGVRIRASPHVVASVGNVARIRDTIFSWFDAVSCLIFGNCDAWLRYVLTANIFRAKILLIKGTVPP